jgi:hypothetical protein
LCTNHLSMNDTAPRSDRTEQPGRGYETRDADVRVIALLCGGLLMLIGVVLLLSGGIYDYLAARLARSGVSISAPAVTRQLPPEPRLQVSPARDLQEMRAREDEVLHSYGWVDRQAGIVRIPIARAIDLLAERGLPARPTEDRDSKIDDGGR